MRRLDLKRHLTSKQDENLRKPNPDHAQVGDYDPENFIQPGEDAEAYKEDGSLLFRVVANAYHEILCTEDEAPFHVKRIIEGIAREHGYGTICLDMTGPIK